MTLGAIAVIATPICLGSEIRQLKQQSAQAALRHIHDSMNQFMDTLVPGANASLAARGRESCERLSDAEKLRFFAIYARFLNTVGSWYLLVRKTYAPSERDETMHNLKENGRYFCDYPGFRELWSELRGEFSGDNVRTGGRLS